MWHHLPFLIPLAQESNLIVPQTNPKPHKSYHPSLHAEFQVQVDLLLQRCLLWDELGRAQDKLLKGEGEEGDKEEKEGENCHRSWLTSDGVWKAFMTMCLWLSVTLILKHMSQSLLCTYTVSTYQKLLTSSHDTRLWYLFSLATPRLLSSKGVAAPALSYHKKDKLW